VTNARRRAAAIAMGCLHAGTAARTTAKSAMMSSHGAVSVMIQFAPSVGREKVAQSVRSICARIASRRDAIPVIAARSVNAWTRETSQTVL
jgi:hypothetical protein